VRDGQARDDVRGEIEADEEAGVRERAGRDLRLPRDVDAGEAGAGEDADDEEVDQLTVAKAQLASPQ
jgi:hypothetical protein